jgi:STE24 endopeptidase
MPAAMSTEAWLVRLSPAAQAMAQAHTDARLLAWTLSGLLVVVASGVAHKARLMGALRSNLERRGASSWAVAACCAGAFAALVLCVRAPFEAWAAWRGDQILHLAAAPSLGARLKASLAAIGPGVVAAILIVPLAQWAIRRRERTWPLILGGIAAPLILAFGWGPYALATRPEPQVLPAGALRGGLERLTARARIPARDIYFSADPSLDIDVTGGFGLAKVVVGPKLLDTPPAEAEAFAGHLMGHYEHGDIFSIWCLIGLLTLANLVAARWLFAPAARLLGAPGPASPADPESLPVFAIIAVILIGIDAPVVNGFIRAVNVGADAFALDHARQPDGLVAYLERDWDHEAVNPPLLERAIFYAHPPLKARIAQAMAWKVAHGD